MKFHVIWLQITVALSIWRAEKI